MIPIHKNRHLYTNIDIHIHTYTYIHTHTARIHTTFAGSRADDVDRLFFIVIDLRNAFMSQGYLFL